MSHILSKHGDVLRTIVEGTTTSLASSTDAFSGLLCSNKATKIHTWIELVIHGLHPFSFLQNETFRKRVKVDSICVQTLQTYMDKLTKVVEMKIAKRLPQSVALDFDGWSHFDTHFLAIFTTFPPECDCLGLDKKGYESVPLDLRPMEYDTSIDADEHMRLIDFVLLLFTKSVTNIVALIGHSISTKKSLAIKMDRGFVGCASHRFNLAVLDIIAEDASLGDCVRNLMTKLRNLIPFPKLREHTPLKPLRNIATRWRLTFNMLQRYRAIREFIPKISLGDVSVLVPRNAGGAAIVTLCVRL